MNRPLHPCIDPACVDCRGDGFLLVRDGERARAEPCGCLERYIHPQCPDCGGKGFVAVKGSEERKMRCPCRGRCPICRGRILTEQIMIDTYIYQIIKEIDRS